MVPWDFVAFGTNNVVCLQAMKDVSKFGGFGVLLVCLSYVQKYGKVLAGGLAKQRRR